LGINDSHAARSSFSGLTCLTFSADFGLPIGALGVGVECVEDGPGGGVSIGARDIGSGVQFPMSSPRRVAAADEHPYGLIDD
jgi:hypothetical protein